MTAANYEEYTFYRSCRYTTTTTTTAAVLKNSLCMRSFRGNKLAELFEHH